MTLTFTDLGVREELVQSLMRSGLSVPTPIQEATIPLLFAGKDVIGQAQTGTGKTLAFLLPICEQIRTDLPATQALIVTPTRELAIQIAAEAKKAAAVVGASILAAYGGQDVERQMRKLNGAPHLVIGTPGRLLDHLRRGSLRLDRVSQFVVDEADQMLDMGFLPDVERIVENMPRNRQTMLFSATMPDAIRQLAARFMRTPEYVRIAGKRVTLEGIKQWLVETTDRAKLQTFLSLVEKFNPYLAVVFCRTKIRAKHLTDLLIAAGLSVDELHGDLTQAKRELVMKRFREAKIQLLVATDVAARGLDVEGVTHVFNYDIPHDADSYIHRIGRTGRAGGKGVAVTLAAPRDRMFLQQIERKIGFPIDRYTISVGSGGQSTFDRNKPQRSARRQTGASRDNRDKRESRSGRENRDSRGSRSNRSSNHENRRGNRRGKPGR